MLIRSGGHRGKCAPLGIESRSDWCLTWHILWAAARLCFYLSFLVGVAALVLIWLLYPKDFDYTSAVADNVTYFQV